MRLDGLHHITMITADAQRTLDFYAGTLGLRLLKRTVNFDAPRTYHLYLGDEHGSPGSLLTWFERPHTRPGRAGAGMIHLIQLGVTGIAGLDFWEKRLTGAGRDVTRSGCSLRFSDPDGLRLELTRATSANPALTARHPAIPSQHAIVGVEGARAYSAQQTPRDRTTVTDVLRFTATGELGSYRLSGPTRSFNWAYDLGAQAGIQGAGTVHHVAWHCADAEQERWRSRVADTGVHVTPVIDRSYFKSIYFRAPEGVLFELATTSPGFTIDEDEEHLGEALRLPPQHEQLRAELARTLTPLTDPRATTR